MTPHTANDALYLDAVRSGDERMAAMLVMEAAKEAGYTVGPVFHGTSDYGFTEFDDGRLGEATGAASAKKGFFFSDSRVVANGYQALGEGGMFAAKEQEVRRLDSLLDDVVYERGDFLGMCIEERTSKYNQLKPSRDTLAQELFRERLRRGSIIDAGGVPPVSDTAGTYSVYLKIRNPLIRDFQGCAQRPETFSSIIDEAKMGGFDGVQILNVIDAATRDSAAPSTVSIVFSPNQIKSSDAVVYGETGEPIPLSLRFTSAKDIRGDVGAALSLSGASHQVAFPKSRGVAYDS